MREGRAYFVESVLGIDFKKWEVQGRRNNDSDAHHKSAAALFTSASPRSNTMGQPTEVTRHRNLGYDISAESPTPDTRKRKKKNKTNEVNKNSYTSVGTVVVFV